MNISLWSFGPGSELMWSTAVQYSLRPLQSAVVWEAATNTLLSAHRCSRFSCFVHMTAYDNTGVMLAENVYFFAQFLPAQIQLPPTTIKLLDVNATDALATVTLISSDVALFVRLSTMVPGHFRYVKKM